MFRWSRALCFAERLRRQNYFDCWGSTKCGDGTWGTHLFYAKWGGTLSKEMIRPFVDAIYGPAEEAMISMQV